MEYFNLLEFKKEPFSNSPEPEFLYVFSQQSSCLQKLELAVRLRRGLNIIIGPVGTGKTTLCRRLIQNLSIPVANDEYLIETFLLLDPAASGTLEFVKTVASVLGVSQVGDDDNEWQVKEKIKAFLFEQGVQQKKNIALIIDEGQKIPENCLEILREFLNYETNSYKLLQIVIFAQPEFRKHLEARENLLDRVNYLQYLKPLSFWQMKAMIERRIDVASIQPERPSLLTFCGMMAIYQETGGYPRKVVTLCHQIMMMMIIRKQKKAGWFLVRSCINNNKNNSGERRLSWAMSVVILAAGLSLASVIYFKNTDTADNPAKGQQRFVSGIDLNSGASKTPGQTAAVTLIDTAPAEENNLGAPKQTNDSQTQIVHVMPERLGEIIIRKKMTFWCLIDNIYGEAGPVMLEKMKLVNPHIKDVDFIYRGTIAKVPLISEKARLLKPDTVILALDKSNEFEKIYYSFIEKKDMENMPSMLFLYMWNEREGGQFVIALNQSFKSNEEAEVAMRALPGDLAGGASVLSRWDGDTVYFNSRFIQ